MPITVAAGQSSGDIAIRMISAPAFQVAGIVTDEDGRPVDNALVKLDLERMPGEPVMPSMGRSRSARSDKAGKFTINGVVNGSYILVAIAPVCCRRTMRVTSVSYTHLTLPTNREV